MAHRSARKLNASGGTILVLWASVLLEPVHEQLVPLVTRAPFLSWLNLLGLALFGALVFVGVAAFYFYAYTLRPAWEEARDGGPPLPVDERLLIVNSRF